MEISASVDMGGLKKLVQGMSRKYQLKVGLLASQGGSDEVAENIDYAGLGAIQEFGCDIKITQKMAAYLHITAKELGLPKLESQGDGYVHIPARSWLVMPLTRKNELLKKLRKKLGADNWQIKQYFEKNADFYSLAILLGVSAVEQIQEAFDTEGFGEWAPNSPYTIQRKGSSMPLIDKGALRKKVTYEVEENG